jgi:hypothetical protein
MNVWGNADWNVVAFIIFLKDLYVGVLLLLVGSTEISVCDFTAVMKEVLFQDIPGRSDQISCILKLIGQVSLKDVRGDILV